MVEGVGQDLQLIGGAGGVFGIDGFIDAGDDDGGVARILPGSVDGVLVPGAIGKTVRVEQVFFDIAQGAIFFRESACGIALGGEGVLAGVLKMMSSGNGGSEVEAGHAGLGRFFLRRLKIANNLGAVLRVVVGRHVGIGHVQRFQAEDASLLLEIDKVGIGKLGEPGVIVKRGMIDAVGAAGADVGGGNAGVLQKWSVVGAAAKIAHADAVDQGRTMLALVHVLVDIVAFLVRGFLIGEPGIVDTATERTGNFFGDINDEWFERWDCLRVEGRAGDADIDIEIGDGVRQHFRVVFCPLG